MPNVTGISAFAFANCSSLAITTIPSKVTSIGNYAFSNCSSLAITTIPSRVTSIGVYAFRECSNIPYLDFSDFTSVPTVATSSFFLTKFPFYFRNQQQLDEWAAATNWSRYASRFQIKPSGVI